MAKKDKITIPEIRAAIQKSGYPLEQRVESVLEDAGYFVTTNDAYPDPITGKSREIDIDAITGFSISRDYFIFARLICECKNNSQPIVFFVKDSVIAFLHHAEVKSAGIPNQFLEKSILTNKVSKEQNEIEYIGLSDFLNFEKFHHYCNNPVSTQYCTFKRKNPKQPLIAFHSDDQHEAFTSLIFALESRIDGYYDNYVIPKRGETNNINIEVLYPVLILEGALYAARTKNGKLKLEKCDHIQYRKQYSSKDKQDTYQIDVIRESFLPKYIKMVEAEMERATRGIKRKKKLVYETINTLVKEARKAGTKTSFREIFSFI
jgi:hypothetical protein